MSTKPKINTIVDNFNVSAEQLNAHQDSIWPLLHKYFDNDAQEWETRWGREHSVNKKSHLINHPRKKINRKSYRVGN